MEGGIGAAELLNSSNIIALIGGGKEPKYVPNKVIIWNEEIGSQNFEIKYTTNVKNIKFRNQR